jgi:hypothetical protein
MKAQPVRLTPVDGYIECAAEDATHITLRIPGPTGLLTLPVLQGNATRAGTGCWTWNGSTDAPTLRPSVLTQYEGADRQWRCHSWITDGDAQFLADSTHALAGQTVHLLDVDLPHTDHPSRHFDHTCPACSAQADAIDQPPATGKEG